MGKIESNNFVFALSKSKLFGSFLFQVKRSLKYSFILGIDKRTIAIVHKMV